jgi:glucokinase
MAEEAVAIGSSKALAALKGEHGHLTALLVERAAREGDEEAIRIYERMGEWLGRAMANLVNIFNFPLYLVAGGLVGGWKLFSPTMFQEIEKRSVTYRESDTRIKKAKLGNKAGLFGAAYLPILEHKSR